MILFFANYLLFVKSSIFKLVLVEEGKGFFKQYTNDIL